MNLLFTVDERYVPPLMTALGSIFANNRGTAFGIYLVHAGLPGQVLSGIGAYCARHESALVSVRVPEGRFEGAPVVGHYTTAMYYRLLAHVLLPDTVDRVLYLDPDILVIGRLDALYETDLAGSLYAAACHEDPVGVTDAVNRLRLALPLASAGYFNTGVLLMDLSRRAEMVAEDALFALVDRYRAELILPDQDVFNALYGARTLRLDESLYNYDVRHYDMMRVVSGGVKDLRWVMENTVVLHFCGKAKPWRKGASGRFVALYLHYMHRQKSADF